MEIPPFGIYLPLPFCIVPMRGKCHLCYYGLFLPPGEQKQHARLPCKTAPCCCLSLPVQIQDTYLPPKENGKCPFASLVLRQVFTPTCPHLPASHSSRLPLSYSLRERGLGRFFSHFLKFLPLICCVVVINQ